MGAKHRKASRALHQLHRRRPPRVHFDRMHHATVVDEVHTAHTHKAEGRGGNTSDCVRLRAHRRVRRPAQEAATIAEPARAKGGVAHELARGAEHDGLAPGRDEHHRPRWAVDEPLRVVADAAHAARATAGPATRHPNATASAASSLPGAARVAANEHVGRVNPGGAKRVAHGNRITCAAQRLGRVSPQPAADRQRRSPRASRCRCWRGRRRRRPQCYARAAPQSAARQATSRAAACDRQKADRDPRRRRAPPRRTRLARPTPPRRE